ncbi:MAG: hypothetical protein ACI80F_000535, partial [Natronomonas sp.]
RAAPWAISRYRTATTKLGLGIDVADPITAANARRANRILASALAARFEQSLRAEYRTPEAAAANVTTDEVRIVVRRWEP